jgi:polyisoprenoid-binding protein YceI
LAGLLLAAAASASADAGTTVYRVEAKDAHAGFDLKVTLHTVHGVTSSVTGRVRVEGDLGGPLALSGTIDVDGSSLVTGNRSRDKDLHGKSLDVARYPTISLVPARFSPSGPADGAGRIPGTLDGDLTIRGVTKRVAIDLSLLPDGGNVKAEGRFDVVWAEFGIPDPSFLFLKVDKVAHAHFEVTFVPVPADRP